MWTGRKIFRYLYLTLAVLAMVGVFVSLGCAGDRTEKHEESASLNGTDSSSETIQQEVMKKISEKVLGGIPLQGEYGRMMERGVLRAALPQPESPYVMVDPEFGIPGGLFPALLSEISNVMILKLNMEVLSDDEYNKLLKGDNPQKFDIYVVLEDEMNCLYKTNVFYDVRSGGTWKSLCIAGTEGEELEEALGDILTYFNKSGIFARIYERYAEE